MPSVELVGSGSRSTKINKLLWTPPYPRPQTLPRAWMSYTLAKKRVSAPLTEKENTLFDNTRTIGLQNLLSPLPAEPNLHLTTSKDLFHCHTIPRNLSHEKQSPSFRSIGSEACFYLPDDLLWRVVIPWHNLGRVQYNQLQHCRALD